MYHLLTQAGDSPLSTRAAEGQTQPRTDVMRATTRAAASPMSDTFANAVASTFWQLNACMEDRDGGSHIIGMPRAGQGWHGRWALVFVEQADGSYLAINPDAKEQDITEDAHR